MNLQVSAQSEQFLQQQVEAGTFVTKEAALEAAIELLKRTADLRAQVEGGIDQLDSGDFLELDDSALDKYFDELLRVAAKSGPDRDK